MEIKNQPQVTYLICNYNYGEWIQNAVESVLNQTIPCNLCIVDDLSTDNSTKTIENKFPWLMRDHCEENIRLDESITKNNKKILFIQKKQNTGPSDSRNIGIEYCLDFTDIFAILDADDIAHPEKTEKLLPYFEDDRVAVVYADYKTLNVDTGFYTNVYKHSFDHFRLIKECIVHSGAFISKQALLDVKDDNGYYDKYLRCAEDYDIWLRISQKYMILHHPECLTTVRVSSKNSTNSVSSAIWQKCWQRIGEKLRASQ